MSTCISCGKIFETDEKEDENPTCPDCLTNTTCLTCGESFSSSEKLQKHTYNYHQQNVCIEIDHVHCEFNLGEDDRYSCVLCSKAPKGFELLQRHFKNQHSDQVIERKRKPEDYTFDEACTDVFMSKKVRAPDLSRGLGLAPLSYDFKLNNNSVQYFDVVNESTISALEQLNLLDKEITCVIRKPIATKEEDPKAVIDFSNLTFTDYPKFQNIMGPYQEIDDALLIQLNNSPNLAAVARLFVGGLLLVGGCALLILTVEIYSREAMFDVHAEHTFSSFPESLQSSQRRYDDIKVTSTEVSEGGAPIKKLVIGIKGSNLLITSTFLLSPHSPQVASAGPSMNQALNTCNLALSCIFLQKKKISTFSKHSNSNVGASNYRQVNSEMDHKSSYYPFRSSIFESTTLQPATVFTLHDYPTVGYSLSSKNKLRKVSFFFSLVASILNDNGFFAASDMEDMDNLDIEHEKLDKILIELGAEVKKSGKKGVPLIKFLQRQQGLSTLTQSLSANISTINTKVEANITTFMSDFLGKI